MLGKAGMLCGLSRPTSGSCAVDGVDLLRAGSEARSRLGYMAQKFSLYPDIPVRENITIFAELYGLSSERRKLLLPELAEALELQPYLRSRTGSLPLGQKQRLALLCATLHEPPVLFLDEPTSGVDARTRRDFWKHISAMLQSFSRAFARVLPLLLLAVCAAAQAHAVPLTTKYYGLDLPPDWVVVSGPVKVQEAIQVVMLVPLASI